MNDQDERDIFSRQEFEDESEAEAAETFNPFDGEHATVSGSIEEQSHLAEQAERDERDASIDDAIPRPWEDVTESVTALHLTIQLVEEMSAYAKDITDFYAAGLPEDTLTASVSLNMLNGGLVIGALQLAGTLTPEIRPHVAKLLDLVNESRPWPSEADKEAIGTVSDKVMSDRVSGLVLHLPATVERPPADDPDKPPGYEFDFDHFEPGNN